MKSIALAHSVFVMALEAWTYTMNIQVHLLAPGLLFPATGTTARSQPRLLPSFDRPHSAWSPQPHPPPELVIVRLDEVVVANRRPIRLRDTSRQLLSTSDFCRSAAVTTSISTMQATQFPFLFLPRTAKHRRMYSSIVRVESFRAYSQQRQTHCRL